MDPLSLLTTIYSVYDNISNKVKLVIANREQFTLLTTRCSDIIQMLRDVMSNANKAKSMRVGSLQTLLATLEAVDKFITQSRFLEMDRDGLYYKMLEVYYSNEDKVKFKELNDALTQNIHDCNFAIGVANLQQQLVDSERKDRRAMEQSLVEVLGGVGMNLDDTSAVGGFLKKHQEIKSIIESLASVGHFNTTHDVSSLSSKQQRER